MRAVGLASQRLGDLAAQAALAREGQRLNGPVARRADRSRQQRGGFARRHGIVEIHQLDLEAGIGQGRGRLHPFMRGLGVEATHPQIGIVLAGIVQQFLDRPARRLLGRQRGGHAERQRGGKGGEPPRGLS
ncbi:MAG: hypothetical protein CVU31_15730 [Betaproteobacteria bacterium HGW-Betaproteobacteria-4]|nr:MAG: hypothetical protein CVU31_15730 [Betaproteobacteria bacterium HGW-Betaproteobacteria-4]